MKFFSKGTGMRSFFTKYQFLPTNILHGWTTHYKTLIGKNWYLARTSRMPVEDIVGEGENAAYQHFLLFL